MIKLTDYSILMRKREITSEKDICAKRENAGRGTLRSLGSSIN